MSPWGGSIFRTRAPLSASQVVANGPARAWERSRTRRSSSAIGMVRSGPFRMRSLFGDPLAEAVACALEAELADARDHLLRGFREGAVEQQGEKDGPDHARQPYPNCDSEAGT